MRFTVNEAQAGLRLDTVCAGEIASISRAKIQKAIKNGDCLVDGQLVTNPAQKLRLDQLININFSDNACELEPTQGELSIIHADEWLAALDKPPGLTVHPCPSCREETLANRLLGRFPQLARQGGERPGIAHRLDKDTSGIILVALTEDTRIRLSREFAKRTVHKKYLALVYGVPPLSGATSKAIGRHPHLKTRMAVMPENKGGRPAFTSWRRLWTSKKANISLLEVEIATGRTHQIRVHLADLGFPLLGDAVYAPRAIRAMAPRQMLHSWQISLIHPHNGQLVHYKAPLPQDFMDTLLINMKNFKKLIVTGNAGCGKSSFCENFQKAGVPVISADALVSRLYSGKSEATAWLRAHLPEEVLNPDFTVNKNVLFTIMEQDPGMRREIEKMIHGLVFEKINSFWVEAMRMGHSMAMAEIPLYFESDPKNRINDAITIGIKCEAAQRAQRLKANRGWDDSKILAMRKWQWPEEKKMAACDIVVDNNSSLEALAQKSRQLLLDLENMENDEIAELKICLSKLNT